MPALAVLPRLSDHAVEQLYQQAAHGFYALDTLLAHDVEPTDIPDDLDVVELDELVTVGFDDGHFEHYLLVDSSLAAILGGIRISTDLPLGHALLGCRVGDRVEVLAPVGTYPCTCVRTFRSTRVTGGRSGRRWPGRVGRGGELR